MEWSKRRRMNRMVIMGQARAGGRGGKGGVECNWEEDVKDEKRRKRMVMVEDFEE